MSDKELHQAEDEHLAKFWSRYASALKAVPREPPFFLSDVVRGEDVHIPDNTNDVVQPISIILPVGIRVQLTRADNGSWLATATPPAQTATRGTVRLILSALPKSEDQEDFTPNCSAAIVLRGSKPAQYDFGHLENEFGEKYGGFSWSAVFVPTVRDESLATLAPEGQAANQSRVTIDPEALARDIINELRFTSLVPPSRLLDRSLRRVLLEEARKQAADRLPNDEALRAFLVACAIEIRKVRRTSAEVTSKSGAQALELDAARLIWKMTCQDHVLAAYKADEDLREPATWFRLSEDAAMETAEVAELYSADVAEVSDALNELRAEVQRRAEFV